MKHIPSYASTISNAPNIINIHASSEAAPVVTLHSDNVTACQNSIPNPVLHSWKLYKNPFFTQGKLGAPKRAPRYLHIAPVHRVTRRCFTSRGPFLIRSRHPRSTSGSSLVSARKLAASFWEQHAGLSGLNNAKQPHCHCPLIRHGAQAEHVQPPSDALDLSSLSFNCQQVTHSPSEYTAIPRRRGTISHNMASSQTLINVLHRLKSVEESQVRSMTMLNKLRLEVEDLSSRLQELELSRESSLREMNHLLQRFGEQVAISRKKEQEKARLAILHLREEMEQERTACRLLKVQNKKLTKELTEVNIAATDACEELDKERKARELLEDVCNELAREIGEDKAEVEQLKQEQEKSRERLEEELKTLRMAMALRRGERTRSKLSEADRFELEGERLVRLRELSHKFEAFTSTAIEGRKEEIHSQVQQTKAVSGDLGLLQLEDYRGGQGETEKVGSLPELSHDRACSNAAEHPFGSPHDDPLSGPHKRAPSSGTKHNVLIEEAQRPRKARRRPCMSGHHRRSNMPVRPQGMAFDMTKSDFWKAPHVNLAWHSSDDDNNSNREQAMVALPGHLPHHLEMGHVIEGAHRRVHDDNLLLICDARREKQVFSASCPPSSETTSHFEQNLSDVRVEGIHKRQSSARFDDVGCVAKLDLKLDTDMGRGTCHSFSEDDTPCYPASSSRGKRRGKQEALAVVRIHDGMKRLGMQNDRHSHEQHGDLQCEVGRGVETSDVDDFYFEPVRRLSDGHGNTSSLIDDDGDKDNMAGKRSCCSVIGEQVCCNIGSKDSPNDDNTESMRMTLVTRQGALSNQQVESSNKVEVRNSLSTSPWRSGSTKPLQCFWPPSPDAFGGAKTHRKAASSSCTPTNTDHHDQPIKGRSWSPATSRPYYDDAGGGHERQTSVSMKSNSLGAQLIKARELDTKEKPAKTGFRISPLRRVLSHG